MARNDELIDDIFADVVEDVKHEEIKVEQANDPFDNVLYVLRYQHGTISMQRWLERQLSLFPGVTRFRVTDKSMMSDEEWEKTILEYGTQKMQDLYMMSYIIYFDMFTGSILEVRALMLLLSRRIMMCKLNSVKIEDFESTVNETSWNYSLYTTLFEPHVKKDDYYHRCRALQQIECDNSMYDRWMLTSILFDDYCTSYEHEYNGGRLFEDLRINPNSENLVFMNMYNALYEDLRKQTGRYDCLATKVAAGHMQIIQASTNHFYEKLMPIRKGIILYRQLSRNMPRATLIILETQLDDDEEYMKQWMVFQIPGEDLSVLHDILIGPKEQIDCIIYEAGKKLSTVEIDVRTDAHADDADTSGLNMTSYTKPLYAYAGRYVGNRFIR